MATTLGARILAVLTAVGTASSIPLDAATSISIVADVDLSSSDFADAIRGSNAHFSTAVGTSIEIVDGHRRLQTGETVLTFKFQVS